MKKAEKEHREEGTEAHRPIATRHRKKGPFVSLPPLGLPARLSFNGELLADLRASHGYDPKEIAQTLKVHLANYYRWEKGTTIPAGDNLIALSMLFSVNPFRFFKLDIQLSEGLSPWDYFADAFEVMGIPDGALILRGYPKLNDAQKKQITFGLTLLEAQRQAPETLGGIVVPAPAKKRDRDAAYAQHSKAILGHKDGDRPSSLLTRPPKK